MTKKEIKKYPMNINFNVPPELLAILKKEGIAILHIEGNLYKIVKLENKN